MNKGRALDAEIDEVAQELRQKRIKLHEAREYSNLVGKRVALAKITLAYNIARAENPNLPVIDFLEETEAR